ncbi:MULTISPECIES: NfeD family protein [unclassified Paludibacterium]|uniref:NfeD family protein n=1 Tax=unclassified Paludibacterium TaxID=2618429 RepID=UPI001C059B04|nr:NfeD family protein [Paludibacterium sp. B53371]
MSLQTLLDTHATFWLVGALIALGVEFMTGTLYLLVFAIALTGGGIAALYAWQPIPQFFIASVAGLLALFAVSAWKRRQPPAPPRPVDDPDIGQPVRVLHLRPEDAQRARVLYRGAEWDALLLAPYPAAGQTAFIVGRDGNLLHVSLQPAESR